MIENWDIAVVGAGMAGASIAAELAPHARVLLLEAEDRPGYHATGRSAAFWEECYGGPDVVPLTLASGAFLRDRNMLTTRGALYIARQDDLPAVEAFEARFANTGARIKRLGRSAVEQLVPGIRPEWSLAIGLRSCADIDVASLHQHYLAMGQRAGVELRANARLRTAQRDAGGWLLQFDNGRDVRAAIIVNAAGAWADQVASMAGVEPLGVKPLRRTVLQVRTDPPPPISLPLVLDLMGQFYFKPESGRIWLSPHDETPSPACDVAPEELDVALAIDRLEKVVDWQVTTVERKWAGLRSFAPDRRPIYGFDGQSPGFFWFAGQGGFGIQTAPAAARLGSQLLLGHGRDAMTDTLNPAIYSPLRFAVDASVQSEPV